jgi:hypothetical protein
MHAILFQLKRPDETKPNEHAMWRQAADAVSKNMPRNSTDILAGDGFWLLTGGSAFHLLAHILVPVVNCRVPYKITFIEKVSEWEYTPTGKEWMPQVA